ncbi:MAG: GldG family protein [Bdellovibrionaceae bacterium]|nr:GldG family protein [Pseudobdellovibrionaceae bacterium]
MVKKWAFLYLFVAAFCLALAGIPFLLGVWFPFLYLVVVLGLASFGAWVYYNRSQLVEFLGARSTKNGMSNGAIIFLGFLVLIGINFLSVRYNKSWDITKDQVNSLSAESFKVLDELDEPVSIIGYYQGKQHAAQRMVLKRIFKLYENAGVSKVKTELLDAHMAPSASADLTAEDFNKIVVVVKQGDKTERVAEPISEESITTAMIRLKTQIHSQVYFTMGHGERSPGDESGFGVSHLKQLLESRGFKVSDLSLFNAPDGKVPADASVLVIMGPKKDFLSKEMEILQEYVQRGGKLFVALDPEAEVNLSALFKPWGLEYNKHFVASFQSVMPLIVIGSEFDGGSPITDKFSNAQVLFPLSGSWTGDLEHETFQYEPLVKTNEYSFSVQAPQEIQRVMEEAQATGQIQGQVFDLGVMVTRRPEKPNPLDPHGVEAKDNESFLKDEKEGDPESFISVLFADSDFVSNEYIFNGFNKDLALNALTYLSGQKDLITIRSNEAQPTTIKLSPTGFNVASLFGLSVPFVFLVLTFVFWIRRRAM